MLADSMALASGLLGPGGVKGKGKGKGKKAGPMILEVTNRSKIELLCAGHVDAIQVRLIPPVW